MWRFMALLLLTLSSATSLQSGFYTRAAPQTAASESQLKFAVENKYDDTGPGAKKPEYAYNTYKNLEDALIAYLDDPDTKLPEHERAKAVHKLLATFSRPAPVTSTPSHPTFYNSYSKPQYQPQPKSPQYQTQARMPFGYSAKTVLVHHNNKPAIPFRGIETTHTIGNQPEKKFDPIKFKKFHSLKGNPLSLSHYTRDPELKAAFDQFDPHPKYTFSYGVHDKSTGDLKKVSETRDGGIVHGFYTYVDPNGHHRTVRYQADDVHGFKATIKHVAPGLAK